MNIKDNNVHFKNTINTSILYIIMTLTRPIHAIERHHNNT